MFSVSMSGGSDIIDKVKLLFHPSSYDKCSTRVLWFEIEKMPHDGFIYFVDTTYLYKIIEMVSCSTIPENSVSP